MSVMLTRVFLVSLFSVVALAKSSGSINRGGLGFLFTDNNSFSNPGNFGKNKAFAFDAKYDTSGGGSVKGATTSMVYGSGMVGIGAFATRSGSNLTTVDSYNDNAGVGLGFSAAKGKVLIGAGYRREISTGQSDDGRADVAMTVVSAKGLNFGVGASTQLNSASDEVKTATIAMGYLLGSGLGLEVDGVVNNLSTTKDFTAGVYATHSGQNAFISVGYLWNNLISLHGASARLGFVLEKSVDISVYSSHTFVTGASPSYGGSFRFAL